MHPMAATPNDTATLLDAVKGGSVDALGAVYRRHADEVFTTAYRITGSPDEAEDVMQDVFVGLPRALEAYREQGRFGGWLQRLATRTALMRLRSARRKREAPLAEAARLSDDVAGPGKRADAAAAVGRLPDSLRLVFVLKEIEGYSHDEIAALLGITAGASAARLSRAWSRLRKELR